MRAGADIGGTFTDVIVFDAATAQIRVVKLLSSQDLHSAILDGITRSGVDMADIETLVHGSTVVINTLLERKGAATALVTTRGFRDTYEIGRINRPDSFNLHFRKHVPLVERARRFEVDERMLPGGELQPLDRGSAVAVAEQLAGEDVDAVAVLLLHSYAHPEHEQELKTLLEERLPSCFVSVSHEVSREYREFERTSTVVANAYVGPRVSSYLADLEHGLQERGMAGELLLMQSNGGLFDTEAARTNCIAMIESGPAGGVIGSRAVVEDLGIGSAVAFDMGGTTAKAGVIEDGKARIAHEYFVGPYGTGLPIQTAVMDIHEVGTGGGSIASVSEFGELRVGPISAGASPGPAAYGLGGTHPTVTDANVVLGRLNADLPLAGGLALDREAAREAMRVHVAEPLGMSIEEAASGVVEIANTAMGYAISAVTVERGLDPGALAMIAYGGAGPLHATQVARELGMRTVVIPPNPGVFSAYGMLFADLEHHSSRTFIAPLSDAGVGEIHSVFEALLAEIVPTAVNDSPTPAKLSADMRYVGQEHSVTVPIDAEMLVARDVDGIRGRFDELHDRLFSHSAAYEAVEVVTLRVVTTTPTAKPQFGAVAGGTANPEPVTRAAVELPSGRRDDVPFYEREGLAAGAQLSGPAVVVEPTTSTVLLEGDRLVVHEHGHMTITVEEH
jgi:N-methylhydantoinase A